MYEFISGELAHVGEDHVVVAAAGIGYRITVPATSLAELNRRCGEEVTLYTTLHVSDSALRLFGFASREQRELFGLFQSVNGVGPALAMTLLGSGTLDQLLRALSAGDPDPLMLVKGVGRKMAQRLCLELKDKVALIAADSPTASPLPDLAGALQALGFSRAEALRAADGAISRQPDETDIEALLKEALKEGRSGS